MFYVVGVLESSATTQKLVFIFLTGTCVERKISKLLKRLIQNSFDSFDAEWKTFTLQTKSHQVFFKFKLKYNC